MRREAPPAKQAVILICRKCGSRLESVDGNPSKELQRALKAEIKDVSSKKNIRAVMTDCLDVCPKGRIAACVVPMNGGDPEFLSVAPNDSEKFAKQILAGLVKR